MVSSTDEATHLLEDSPLETRGPLLQSLQDEMEYLTQEKSNMLNNLTKTKACSTLQKKEIYDLTKAIKSKDAILAHLKQSYLKELKEIDKVLQDK
ncbi:hypothetical protein O181_035565 [Austropuccinia psidii MF-1]|uniref:Uncharacterized protein n=1 Tax=Austropuccinia psidii MF-1 TaxID=1389203 RepID=A0A9Q3HBA8_9BASI|nr:hypothetical protein [Austropuccinia psidii MF-1]